VRTLLAAVLIALAWAAPAAASTTTVGSDLLGEPFSQGDAGQNTYAFAAGYSGWTLPDGVIVRWRIKIGARGGYVRLRVLRPAGEGKFVGAASSATEIASNETVSTFAARVPVVGGDLLALDDLDRVTAYDSNGNGTLTQFSPAFEDGQTRSGNQMDRKLAMLVNADVETDGDRDGFGDDTQDGCPGTAGAANGCAESAPPPPPPPPPPEPGPATAPALTLEAVPAAGALRLRLTSSASGVARITAAIRIPGRTRRVRLSARRAVTASRATLVTLRAQGRKRRTIARALRRRGSLRGTATATMAGTTPATATFVLRR
jgi:hypothetical protein